MKIYGAIRKIEEEDDGTIRIHGIASTEDVDSAGEIVRAAAMRAAIPGYQEFPALREMHGLNAAGTTLEIDVGDDNITRIVGHVVDPVAVKKCLSGTYRGLSIGGKVTQRDTGNRKVITGIELKEISLVDRPCNECAKLSLFKVGGVDTVDDDDMNEDTDEDLDVSKREFNTAERRTAARSGAAMKDGSYPIENKADLRNAIQAFGRAKNPAATKAHIKRRAAALGATDMLPDSWKADGASKAANSGAPPASLDDSRVTDVLSDWEVKDVDTPGVPVAGRHVSATFPPGEAEAREEAVEVTLAGRDREAEPDPLDEEDLAPVEAFPREQPKTVSAPRRGGAPRNAAQNTAKKAAGASDRKRPPAKDEAREEDEDEEEREEGTEDNSEEEREERNAARDTADKPRKRDDKKAAAKPNRSTTAKAEDPIATARDAADAAMRAATLVLQKLAKREVGYSSVLAPGMALRKDLLATGRLGCLLCELAYCLNDAEIEKLREGDDSEVPAKLREALDALAAAYRAMSDEELEELLASANPSMNGQIAMAASGGDLAKAFAGIIDDDRLAKLVGDDRSSALEQERDTLLKTVSSLTETMTALSDKVETLANQPLPSKTVTKAADPTLISVSKEQDANGHARHNVLEKAEVGTSEEDVRKAMEGLSPEERALLLMKASLHPTMGRVITR